MAEPYNIQPATAQVQVQSQAPTTTVESNKFNVGQETSVQENVQDQAKTEGKEAVVGAKIDGTTSMLQIDRMIGNLEGKVALTGPEILQLNNLRNKKKTMSAERDNKPPKPSRDVEEKKFKLSSGDLIQYMYDEWILASISWVLQKTDKYIRIGGNKLLDKWLNSGLDDNDSTAEQVAKKLEEEGKSTTITKEALDLDKFIREFGRESLSRLDAVNDHILMSFNELKNLDPSNPEDALKIKEMFGDEKGSLIISSLSGLTKEEKDKFIDLNIRNQENSHLITKATMETSIMNHSAQIMHNMASNKDFLKGLSEEEKKLFVQEGLKEKIEYNIGKAISETRMLDAEGVSAYLDKNDKQAAKAYDESRKNIEEGNTWDNGKKPENPYLYKKEPYSVGDEKLQAQAKFAKEETAKILNLDIPQEKLNKDALGKSAELLSASIVAGTYDKVLHQGMAIEKLIDDARSKHIETIAKNRENFTKNFEEFSKLNLQNPKEYKQAEDLLGKKVAQETKNMSKEDKEAYLEKHKEEKLNRLDISEKIIDISANGAAGRALHALAHNPEVFTKKDENGKPDQKAFESYISQVYHNNIKENLSNVNKGIEKTLGNNAAIMQYLEKAEKNSDKCLAKSEENIKNGQTADKGKKAENNFYKYNDHSFDKAEERPENPLAMITLKEALSLENIAKENEKKALDSLKTKEELGVYREEEIKKLKAKLGLAIIEEGPDNKLGLTMDKEELKNGIDGNKMRVDVTKMSNNLSQKS